MFQDTKPQLKPIPFLQLNQHIQSNYSQRIIHAISSIFKNHSTIKTSFVSCLFFFFFLQHINAQHKFTLHISPIDKDTLFLQKYATYKTQFPDSSLIIIELKSIIQQFHNAAFLEASVDSLAWRDSTATAQLHIGEAYQWASLRNGNVEPAFLEQGGFRERLFSGKPFDRAGMLKMQEKLLAEAENNGYPFAAVRLDSVRLGEGRVEAQLFLEKGRLVFFDSLNLDGDVKISERYLRNYLGIAKGDLYSRRKVLKIRDRVRELPFLQEKKNVLVSFWEDQASLRLFLEKKRASRFDFLLGILPDNGRPDQKLLLTGTFNAEMQNQFGKGERIFVAFERLRPQTQKLELNFAYPYIFNLPFGVDLRFNQYKRDSTYTDITGDFGVQYLFEGGNYLKAFWSITASNLLVVDTVAIKAGRIPDQLDVQNDAYGLEAGWQLLDYRFNPRRGWNLLLRTSAGFRQIRRNQAILNVAESFYDTLPGKSIRFTVGGKVERYFPLAQRSAFKLAVTGGAILSEEPVYLNEQTRLGGNRLLRGFDEESVFATSYAVFTGEFRLLVGQNSYFYLFGDYGYVEDRRAGRDDQFARLFGFGGGLTFETSAGVFGISLGFGKPDGAAFDFREPKVHFGYVSYF